VSDSGSARESEHVPSESLSQLKVPSQNLTSTVESESDEGGAVSNPRRRRAARCPVQAFVPSSRKTPVPKPDSSSDEEDLPHSVRDSPGTPSKSSSHVPRPTQTSQASSIDSEAPRVPRYQKKKPHLQKLLRSLSPAEPSQPSQPAIVPTRQGLLESLNKFKEEFEKDHGTVTYWRLHDAKVAIETAPPSPFMDKGDVFASLRGKGVQLPLGKPIPEGSSREKINQFVRALLICKNAYVDITPSSRSLAKAASSSVSPQVTSRLHISRMAYREFRIISLILTYSVIS